MVGWAVARLLVMRQFTRAHGQRSAGMVSDAWGAGLIPYAFAVTGWLTFVAWSSSAVITWRRLRQDETTADTATRAVLWAFGLEAAATLAAYMLRNGIMIAALLDV